MASRVPDTSDAIASAVELEHRRAALRPRQSVQQVEAAWRQAGDRLANLMAANGLRPAERSLLINDQLVEVLRLRTRLVLHPDYSPFRS